MRRLMQARPSPSMVVALIALFIALGGSAVALQGKNSVDSGDVKPDVLRAEDLADDSVTFRELAKDAVNPNKILDGSVHAAALGDTFDVVTEVVQTAPGDDAGAVADCGSGAKVLGGGFSVISADGEIEDSRPSATLDGWFVRGPLP